MKGISRRRFLGLGAALGLFAATLPALKEAFLNHAKETEGQIERLQQVFELIGKTPRSKTCDAMQGIMSEMEEDLEEFGGSPAADAAIPRTRHQRQRGR